MMIIANNSEYQVEDNCTLQTFIETYISNCKKSYCAAAVNKNFIPRVHYATTTLNDRDVIDIVIPMQGG